MPGYICHLGATVICAHAGQAMPTSTVAKVRVANQPVTNMTSTYSVTGCALTGTTVPPCATAMFTVAATRVRAGGAPVLIQSGVSTCIPTGTPLQVLVTQVRVKAT
jgi:hypothetical protein